MNHLEEISKLKNRYFIMRHGESEANAQGLITSDPDVCLKKYALTERGARTVFQTIKKHDSFDKYTIIYTSDFLRTKQTAQIVQDFVQAKPYKTSVKLRERYFGKYDGKSTALYAETWTHDEADAAHEKNGVESAESVMSRMTSMIMLLERTYGGKTILLVSHGDPLQILETAFKKKDSSAHRTVQLLKLAQIREIVLK